MGTMANNPYSLSIYNGEETELILKNFVQYHYEQKNVVGFIVGSSKETYQMLTMADFLESCVFSVQSYGKKSGTRSCPLKDQDGIMETYPHFIKRDKKLYTPNEEEYGTYFSFADNNYFISKSNGEIKKRSKTKNLTYHIEVKLK
jgi:hypothetical protein